MSTTQRIALVQIASPDDETQTDRIVRVEAMLRQYRDVDLFVLPEMWSAGYSQYDDYDELAETVDGEGSLTVSMGRRVATNLDAYVHVGSFIERGADGRLFNTSAVIDPGGEIVQLYRKIHVFGYRSRETELITAGDTIDVLETPFGKTSSTICYDLRFPGLWDELSRRGSETVLVPAAWPAARREHWCLLAQARAVEHQMWIIAVNSCGEQSGHQLGGFSRLVDPSGRIVAECGDAEEIVVAEMDPALTARVRADFPVIADRLDAESYRDLGSSSAR